MTTKQELIEEYKRLAREAKVSIPEVYRVEEGDIKRGRRDVRVVSEMPHMTESQLRGAINTLRKILSSRRRQVVRKQKKEARKIKQQKRARDIERETKAPKGWVAKIKAQRNKRRAHRMVHIMKTNERIQQEVLVRKTRGEKTRLDKLYHARNEYQHMHDITKLREEEEYKKIKRGPMRNLGFDDYPPNLQILLNFLGDKIETFKTYVYQINCIIELEENGTVQIDFDQLFKEALNEAPVIGMQKYLLRILLPFSKSTSTERAYYEIFIDWKGHKMTIKDEEGKDKIVPRPDEHFITTHGAVARDITISYKFVEEGGSYEGDTVDFGNFCIITKTDILEAHTSGLQIFRANVFNNCMVKHLINISKKTKRINCIKFLKQLERDGVNSEIDLPQVAQKMKSDIRVFGIDGNVLYEAKYEHADKYTHFDFLNTRLNHVELMNGGNKVDVDSLDKLIDIFNEKRESGDYYAYKKNSFTITEVRDVENVYRVKPENDFYKKYMTSDVVCTPYKLFIDTGESELSSLALPPQPIIISEYSINATQYPVVSDFIRSAVHVSGAQFFYEPEDIELIEIDQKNSFIQFESLTKHAGCEYDYYHGFPLCFGTFVDMSLEEVPYTKAIFAGLYEVELLFHTVSCENISRFKASLGATSLEATVYEMGSENNGARGNVFDCSIFQILGYEERMVLPAPEIEFLRNHGVGIRMITGLFTNKTAHLTFPEYMLESNSGVRNYCKWSGILHMYNTEDRYFYKCPQDVKEFNSGVYINSREELMVTIPKDRVTHFSHIYAYIVSYSRISVLLEALPYMNLIWKSNGPNKIPTPQIQGIVKLVMDGFYIVPENRKELKNSTFREKSGKNLFGKYVSGRFMYPISDPREGKWHEGVLPNVSRNNWFDYVIHGPAGSGKSYIVKQEALHLPTLYTSLSWARVAGERNGIPIYHLVNKTNTTPNTHGLLFVDEYLLSDQKTLDHIVRSRPLDKIIFGGDPFQLKQFTGDTPQYAQTYPLREITYGDVSRFKDPNFILWLEDLKNNRHSVFDSRIKCVHFGTFLQEYKPEIDNVLCARHDIGAVLNRCYLKDKPKYKFTKRCTIKLDGEEVSCNFCNGNFTTKTYKGRQPSHTIFSHVSTIHSYQGLTCDGDIWVFLDFISMVNMDMLYSACSRVTNFETLHLVYGFFEQQLNDRDKFPSFSYTRAHYLDKDLSNVRVYQGNDWDTFKAEYERKNMSSAEFLRPNGKPSMEARAEAWEKIRKILTKEDMNTFNYYEEEGAQLMEETATYSDDDD